MSEVAVSVFDFALVFTKTARLHQQIESGLYSLRRVGLFLKKVAEVRKAQAKELSLICSYEVEKKADRSDKDGISDSLICYKSLVESVENESKAETEFAHQIMVRVVEPLLLYYQRAQKERQNLFQQELKLKSKAEGIVSQVRAARAKCLKEWLTLKEKSKGYRPPVETKFQIIDKSGEKIEKAFEKQRQATIKAFEKLDQLLGQAQETAVEFQKYFESVKTLEEQRIRMIRDFCRTHKELERTVKLGPLAESGTALETLLITTNARVPVETFCNQNALLISPGGLPPEVPCTVEILQSKDQSQLLVLLSKDSVEAVKEVKGEFPSFADWPRPSISPSGFDPLPPGASPALRAKYPSQPPPHEHGFYAIVIHDYPKTAESNIELVKGNLVWVYFQEEITEVGSPVWCQGYIVANGHRASPNGTFPSSYVSDEPVHQEIAAAMVAASSRPPPPLPSRAASSTP